MIENLTDAKTNEQEISEFPLPKFPLPKFPWPEILAFGFGVMKLNSNDFWSLSFKELKYAMNGHLNENEMMKLNADLLFNGIINSANGINIQYPQRIYKLNPPNRQTIHEIMKKYPDEKKY